MSSRRMDNTGATFGRETALQLSLRDFLECFPPPQSGRIVEDFQPDFDAHEAFNISKGAVLNFHRQVSPNVPLSFRDPWGGLRAGHMVRVTLPLEFQGKFRLLHFDPVSGSTSPDHTYRRVQDVIEAFPVYIQANANYRGSVTGSQRDNDLSNVLDNSFTYGDRFKLIRLVHKNGKKQLECRKMDDVRILLLPMDCVGNFTVLSDNNEYLLSDLMSMLPRRRRLAVCESTKDKYKIPGLPAGFSGDLYLEEPEAFVEASPHDDPGLIIGLPSSLSLWVSPEEDSYDRGQLLNTFATNNRNAFPVVARVTGWDEETTILENHYVRPGIELVIHGWTRQSKVLAIADGKHYAIPLTYQGKFRFVGQTFNSVADLERAHPAYALKVIEADPSLALQHGDVIRIKRGDSLRMSTGFLRCERVEANGRTKEIKMPVNARGSFEEVLEGNKTSDEYSIRDLVPFVAESGVDVQLVVGSTDQKVKARDLTDDVTIHLCDYVVESAVYVSVETAEAPAFHIPLRTLVYATFVQQLEKQLSPLLMRQNPRLSTLDRCVEVLPEEVFSALRPRDRSPSTTGSSDVNRISYSPLQQSTNSLQAPRWPGLAPKTTSASTGALNTTLSVARSLSPSRTNVNGGGSVGSHSNASRVEVPMSTGSSSTSSRLVPSTGSLESNTSSSNKRESPVSEEQRPASRARSYGEGELIKRKSLTEKIRNRFRRHKSTENVNKVSNQEFSPLSLPREDDRTPTQNGKTHHLAKYNSVDLNMAEPIMVNLPQDTEEVEDDILEEQIKKLQEHQQNTITRHIHTVEIHDSGRDEEPMAEGSTSTPSPTPHEPQATYINVTGNAPPPLRSSSPTPSSVSHVPPRTATPSVVSIPISSVSTAGRNNHTIVQQNNMLNATMMNGTARTVEGQEDVESEAFVYVPEAYRQQMVQQQMYSQQQQVLAEQQQALVQHLTQQQQQQQQQQQPQVREMYVARRPDGQVQAFLPPTSNPNQQPMVRKPVLYRNPTTGQVNQGYVLVPAPGYNNATQQQQMIQNQYVQTSQGYVMMPMMAPQMMMQQQQHLQQQRQQQQQMLNRNNIVEDEEEIDDSVEYSEVNFTSNKQFKLAIPLDGNLYGFSAKKMTEFFKQLKLNDDCVQKCIKAKVDGKKFSRMTEMDLDALGLMHPLVVHFRKLTYKRKFNFML